MVLYPITEERGYFCCVHQHYNTELNYYMREGYLYYHVLYLAQLKYIFFNCPFVCTCLEFGKLCVVLRTVHSLLLLSFVVCLITFSRISDVYFLFRWLNVCIPSDMNCIFSFICSCPFFNLFASQSINLILQLQIVFDFVI